MSTRQTGVPNNSECSRIRLQAICLITALLYGHPFEDMPFNAIEIAETLLDKYELLDMQTLGKIADKLNCSGSSVREGILDSIKFKDEYTTTSATHTELNARLKLLSRHPRIAVPLPDTFGLEEVVCCQQGFERHG